MKPNKYFLLLVLVSLLTAGSVISCVRQLGGGSSDVFKVTRVIDGATIVLDNGKKIRLIGVDTPEKYDCLKLDEDAKRLGKDKELVKKFGQKASKFTQRLCKGKRVRLEYDQIKQDKYGYLLAYVYLSGGRLLNEEIILRGYGFAYLKYSSRQDLVARFKEAEKKARKSRRGLWATD